MVKYMKEHRKKHSSGTLHLNLNPYAEKRKALYVLSVLVNFEATLEKNKDDILLEADIKRIRIDFCEKCACDLGTEDRFLAEDDKDFNDVMQMNNGEEASEEEEDFLLSFLEDSNDFKEYVTEAIEESRLINWK